MIRIRNDDLKGIWKEAFVVYSNILNYSRNLWSPRKQTAVKSGFKQGESLIRWRFHSIWRDDSRTTSSLTNLCTCSFIFFNIGYYFHLWSLVFDIPVRLKYSHSIPNSHFSHLWWLYLTQNFFFVINLTKNVISKVYTVRSNFPFLLYYVLIRDFVIPCQSTAKTYSKSMSSVRCFKEFSVLQRASKLLVLSDASSILFIFLVRLQCYISVTSSAIEYIY